MKVLNKTESEVNETTDDKPIADAIKVEETVVEEVEAVVDEDAESVKADEVDEKTEEAVAAEVVVDEDAAEEGSVAEPLEELLSSKKLSVKFKADVTEAYEQAVTERIKAHTDKLDEEFEAKLAEKAEELLNQEKAKLEESMEETVTGLSEKMLEYTDYAVAQWAKENKLVLENEAKSAKYDKMLESFVSVLSDFGIDINEEFTKTHEAEIAEGKKSLSRIEEQANKETERNVKLVKENIELRKSIVFMKETADLSDVKKDKLKDVIDVVEFEDEAEYTNRIKALIESYFPAAIVSLDSKTLTEDGVEVPEVGHRNPIMDRYNQTIKNLANA